MNEFEQILYNKHLAISRKNQNKPFKLRKNFDNVDETTQFLLTRLASFFNKHKNINVDAFFEAPYHIYVDNDFYFDLKFYTSLKAIKLYREYINKITRDNVNSDETKQFFKNSAKFIVQYCKNNKIAFNQYVSYKEDGYVNAFYSHLKHGHVCYYMLFMFPDFESQFKTVDNEMRTFILDENSNIDEFRTRFYNANVKTKKYFRDVFDICSKLKNVD